VYYGLRITRLLFACIASLLPSIGKCLRSIGGRFLGADSLEVLTNIDEKRARSTGRNLLNNSNGFQVLDYGFDTLILRFSTSLTLLLALVPDLLLLLGVIVEQVLQDQAHEIDTLQVVWLERMHVM
jgi:hypothetical protein